MIAHNQEMVLKHQIITRQKIFQNDLITQVRTIVLIHFDQMTLRDQRVRSTSGE